MNTPHPPIQYVAHIEPVREIRLSGAAELGFWRKRLAPQGLFPYAENGQAILWITATQGAWKGFDLREVTISVSVCLRPDESRPDGFYLVQAFNGSLLLAFTERHLFHTPYEWRKIQLGEDLRQFKLCGREEILVKASLSGNPPAAVSRDETWEGPIFLPRKAASRPGEKFFARLSGSIQAYPFSPEQDCFKIGAAAPEGMRLLQQSGFTGREWGIRACAAHSRSTTYAHHFPKRSGS